MELVATRHAELGEGPVQVGADSPGGQEQALRDLTVGKALRRKLDDLALLRGELAQPGRAASEHRPRACRARAVTSRLWSGSVASASAISVRACSVFPRTASIVAVTRVAALEAASVPGGVSAASPSASSHRPASR